MTCVASILGSGGAGVGLCGSMPCGTVGAIEVDAPETPQIVNFTPTPGIPIGRLQPIAFDITDDVGTFVLVVVFVRFPDGTYEVIYDGDGFAPRYAASSAVTAINCGFHFSVRRLGGWIGSPVVIEVKAVDEDGNMGESTGAFA